MNSLYHSRLLALELTKQLSAETLEKLSQSLANATVDLNPHQVDAALFAFRSPFPVVRFSQTKWASARPSKPG